jgi:hypothetical protein
MGALTVQNIADRARRQFGDAAGVLITDQAIFDWINDAMRECVLDNNLLQVKATALTVAGQANYGFPTDLLRLNHIAYDGEALDSTSVQEASKTIDSMDDTTNFARGTPQTYWVYGNEFFLYPAPNTAGKTLTSYYNRYPVVVTALANTPELPARYDNRLIEYCLAQAAELDDDPNKQQLKMQQFQAGLDKAKDEEEGATDVYQNMGVPLADSYGYSYREDYY